MLGRKIRFGKSFLEDLEHKMNVVSDEPELQECYGITQEQVDAFAKSLPRNGVKVSAEIEIPEHMLACVKGEMENTAEIVWSNAKSEGIKAIGYACAIERQLLKLD